MSELVIFNNLGDMAINMSKIEFIDWNFTEEGRVRSATLYFGSGKVIRLRGERLDRFQNSVYFTDELPGDKGAKDDCD